jgi:mannose/fructose/N-acetylgalactosamine-specific phosphotransferase system component IID
MIWNYIVAHWRGRLGLLRSSLLNGVVVYCLLVFIIVSSGKAFFYTGATVFLLWWIWASVGIFRCGGRYTFDRANTTVRRIEGVAAIAGVVIVGAYMARDVSISLGRFSKYSIVTDLARLRASSSQPRSAQTATGEEPDFDEQEPCP